MDESIGKMRSLLRKLTLQVLNYMCCSQEMKVSIPLVVAESFVQFSEVKEITRVSLSLHKSNNP